MPEVGAEAHELAPVQGGRGLGRCGAGADDLQVGQGESENKEMVVIVEPVTLLMEISKNCNSFTKVLYNIYYVYCRYILRFI